MDFTDVLTTAQVAERFGVTRAAVSLWVAEGRITPVDRIGRAMLFDKADVERLARERAA
jgi:excisionase family DNA binding protein